MVKIKSKKIENIIKVILILSCPFLTILLSNRYKEVHILVGALISLVIFSYIVLKKVNIKSFNRNKFFISVLFSLYMIRVFIPYNNKNIGAIRLITNLFISNLSDGFISKILGLLAFPVLLYFVYIFIDRVMPIVYKFFKSFSKSEKIYFILVLIVGIVCSVVITYSTNAFSMSTNEYGVHLYDTIYVSDSGSLVRDDAYFNVSHFLNDIRQPLFGVFSLPFSVPAKILSEVCFFLTTGYEYATILTIIQFILISISIIMISRMLDLEEKDKKYLYLLFSCSFPYMLWSVILEQYAIATFYLITALYIYYKNKKDNFINHSYVLAVGSLITSGIIFPIIVKFKNIKQWVKDVFKCFLVFLSVFVISGQLPQVMLFKDVFDSLLKDAGGATVTLVDKLEQFFEFIKGMFIATPGYLFVWADIHPSYQLVPVTSLWFLGILIVIICILGFVLNRKNKFVKICMLWIIFSMVILIGFGWGTKERCLALYGLYFAWAYLSLFFMFVRKVFKNKIFKTLMILGCLVMLIFSVREFIEVLRFAIKYY